MKNAIAFTKMNGSGNDFIVIDNRRAVVPENLTDFVVAVCRRKLSVGADGLILIEAASDMDFRWRFFNSDGSRAEMCGNGARCAARFAYVFGIAGTRMTFGTDVGPVSAAVQGERVKVRMTRPRDMELGRRLELSSGPVTFARINTGVPHVVIEREDLEAADVVTPGRELRRHPAFAPAGTNVNFVQRRADGSVAIRTYERGVEDETLACGTGSIAGALVLARAHGLASPVHMVTRSGGVLTIHFQPSGDGFDDVHLEGDARLVYTGVLQPDAWMP
jgi:diaminopimelate epimerase